MRWKSTKQYVIGALLAFTCVVLMAAVNGVFANISASGWINSITGYQVNGAAPNLHVLMGNGTYYVDGTLPSPATIYNQTIDSNGSAQTQRPSFNFNNGSNITASCVDNSGANRTDCSFANTYSYTLPNVGTAGTYTSPTSLTTDVNGRVTSVTAGTGTGRTCTTSIANSTYACYRIFNDGTIEQWGLSNIFGSSVAADISITFPVSFTTPSQATPSFTSEYCTGAAGACSGSHPFTCSLDKATSAIGASSLTIWYDGQGATVQQGQCAWHVIGY